MNYRISYFGILSERRGLADECLTSQAATPAELYHTLDTDHQLGLSASDIRVAVNDEFVPWDCSLNDGDHIAFLPPMSGG